MGRKSTSTACPANRIAVVGVNRTSFTEMASAPSCHNSLTTARMSRSVSTAVSASGVVPGRPPTAVGALGGGSASRTTQARSGDGGDPGEQLVAVELGPDRSIGRQRRVTQPVGLGRQRARGGGQAGVGSLGGPHAGDEIGMDAGRGGCAPIGVHPGHRHREPDKQAADCRSGPTPSVPPRRSRIGPAPGRGGRITRIERVGHQVGQVGRRQLAGRLARGARHAGRRRRSWPNCIRYSTPAHQ